MRWPCGGEVAELTVRQDSPSCPKKCDSNATAPHNVFADDKYAPHPQPGPQQGGPCFERDSLPNATLQRVRGAVHCTTPCAATDGVQRYSFTGGEVSTFEDEESIQVWIGNATRDTHGARRRSGRRAACSDRLRRSEPTCGATR